jgi:mRNA-degrading endonuclease toxin of MazEF toxin-antitoxin module
MHPDGNRVVVIFLFGKRRINGHVNVDQVAFLQWPAMARRIKLV